MKWELIKKKPEVMVDPEPMGLGGTSPPNTMTMTPGPVLSTMADNSTESGPFPIDDILEKIRNKFLNENEPVLLPPWMLIIMAVLAALLILTCCFCIFCMIKKYYCKKKTNKKGTKGKDSFNVKNIQDGDGGKMSKI